jgi:hypothetical protein
MTAAQNKPSRSVTAPSQLRRLFFALVLSLLLAGSAYGQTCLTASDMDEATRTALVNTAKRYFDMAARGDSASLRQNSIASVASDFSGIETAVKDNQSNFTGAQATPRAPFLLKAEGTAPLAHAEFLCGVFGAQGQTKDSAVFQLSNLPPGNYGIAILDVNGAKTPYTLSFVLQQQGTDWKLGGFYAKPLQVAGHDGNWFVSRAREYKAKGQTHNAWLYFVEARELLAPVPFMSTIVTDKLYDEAQSAKPADLPTPDKPLELVREVGPSNTYQVTHEQPQKETEQLSIAKVKSYKLVALFPLVVGTDLDLVVKYQSADVSDTAQAFQNNMLVMKALIAKYPELREAFGGIVARAVEPSGRDYGSLMAMKDIK